MSETVQFTLGVHIKLEDEFWLPVRIVHQSTFHEEQTTGTVFIEEENFVELRNKNGLARFASLSSNKTNSRRDPGPCRGIKPYWWKGDVPDGATEMGEGTTETVPDEIQPGGEL